MNKIVVTMPYIGGNLSVNSYKIIGRGGRRTNKTKWDVEVWMGKLTDEVKSLKIFPTEFPIVVSILGKFEDNRYPDIHNLHKVVGDAIRDGLGIDDKFFQFSDPDPEVNCNPPELVITILFGK